MSQWLEPARAGIVTGSGVFLLLLPVIVVVQRRSFGRIHLTRMLLIAALCIYASALLAYTVVPSPDMAELCRTRIGGKLRLRPLHSITEIIVQHEGMSTWRALVSWGAWQLAMNVALFIPFGVFARGLFGRGVLGTTLLGMLISLLFEATQYTGFWGLYSCGIRVADIDDVLSNTLGTLIGALLGPLLLGDWLPRAHDLKQRMRANIGLDRPGGRG
ncbi:VanZ family protein [Brachybacterium hainanense]|uniref:VanZ family protein n=1 Tax=Brachybacterium hainanense TaxID=1541174 RepID=A0ABV6RDN3_9MICO